MISILDTGKVGNIIYNIQNTVTPLETWKRWGFPSPPVLPEKNNEKHKFPSFGGRGGFMVVTSGETPFGIYSNN